MNKNGVVYILTNPSFPDYVKIGYSTDLEKRLSILNTSVPCSFMVYATYETIDKTADVFFHKIIELLNPDFRVFENFYGEVRSTEFFKMKAEHAFAIFYYIAKISCTEKKLHCYEYFDSTMMEIPFNENVIKEYFNSLEFHGNLDRERKKSVLSLQAKPSINKKFKSISDFYGCSRNDFFEIMVKSAETQALSDGWKDDNKVL